MQISNLKWVGIIWLLWACTPADTSTGKLSPMNDLDPCTELLDSQDRADCQSFVVAMMESQTKGMLMEMGAEYLQRFFGPPMTFSENGQCLAHSDGNVVFKKCQDFDQDFKWHLVDAEISYLWQGTRLWGQVFFMVSRDSVRRWAAHNAGTDETPRLECVDFSKPLPKGQDPRSDSLALVPCTEANTIFLTVPNDVSGDDNLYGHRWTRLLSIDAQSPQFAAMKEAILTYNPNLTEPCEEGCLSQAPLQQERLDFGAIDHANNRFVRLPSNGLGWTLGGCLPHRYDGERPCFMEGEEGTPLSTYKKLYHRSLDDRRGYVVQVRKGDRCLLWDGSLIDCNTSDIDVARGGRASQFRLAFVEGPLDKTEPFVQLQRVHGEETNVPMCYNIEQGREVECCNEGESCGVQNALMFNDLTVFQQKSPEDSFQLHFCVVSSSTHENIAYDCFDFIDPKWKRYQTIADILGFIPIAGSIPSYVLEGLICKSGEVTIAQAACMSMTIGLAIDVLLLPLDIAGFYGTATAVTEQLVRKGAVKPSASMIFDYITDPVLASFAYYTAGRVVRQLPKELSEEALTETLKEMSDPVTRSVLRRILSSGVLGANASSSFTSQNINNILRNAGNIAAGAL